MTKTLNQIIFCFPPTKSEYFFQLNSTIGERTASYHFDKADWLLYKQMCREKIQIQMMRNVADPILKFNEIADQTITKTSINSKTPRHHDSRDSLQNRIKVEQQFEKYHTSDNHGNLRIFRAKARRTLKQNRGSSCGNFVSLILWLFFVFFYR